MKGAKRMEEFSKSLFIGIYAVRGEVDLNICEKTVEEISKICKMKKDGLFAAYWKFPIKDNDRKKMVGGCGFTYVQPIVDSFITCDQWQELKGAFFFVVSCVAFDFARVERYFRDNFEAVNPRRLFIQLPELPQMQLFGE